jgi:hypothetical protein
MRTFLFLFVHHLWSFVKGSEVLKLGSADGSSPDMIANVKRWSHTFPSVWTIGAVLSSPDRVRTFVDAVERENNAPVGSRRLPLGVRLNSTDTGIIMDANPIRAAKTVCEVLIPTQPYVVIASRSAVPSDLAPMAVSFTCGFYKIPVIGLSARESTFSDKVSYSYLQ